MKPLVNCNAEWGREASRDDVNRLAGQGASGNQAVISESLMSWGLLCQQLTGFNQKDIKETRIHGGVYRYAHVAAVLFKLSSNTPLRTHSPQTSLPPELPLPPSYGRPTTQISAGVQAGGHHDMVSTHAIDYGGPEANHHAHQVSRNPHIGFHPSSSLCVDSSKSTKKGKRTGYC